ncbi:MAG: hypothetical protein IPI46_13695 [Bacteroidetes bacterium]|nr:hypothetical protein [Bacteroidota bacterium]
MALYDANNVKKLEFVMDYLTASSAVSSGYKSLGVSGGDGSMVFGTASNVLNVTTSLDQNFNTFGYVLTTNSPATNTSYAPNATYPNWIYEVWYEATVNLSVFGAAGFGSPSIVSVHASPSKTGNNTEPVTPGNCCSNVTSGGTIGSDEIVCGLSFDPALITNITLPSGGNSNQLEYVWLISTDAGANYTLISGATGSTYDPGVITQTTWYRRCARRQGCPSYDGESNWIKKELKTPPTANAGPDYTICLAASQTIGTAAITGNTYLWTPATGLSSATIAQPLATPSATSTYTVTVTGSNGCTASDAVVITVNICTVNITGNVFEDNNGPTNVDGTGIGNPSGLPLYANLMSATGTIIATTTVNANGTFTFLNVTPNANYTINISTTQGIIGNPAPSPSLPSGWSNVSEDCCDNTGNDGTTNGNVFVAVSTSNVSNVNFGIRQALSLGNTIWVDVNRNGIKEASETGLENASVKLYADANSDGIPDGAALQITTSNASGEYVFEGLNPGNYMVGVIPPTGNVYTSSVSGEETNPNNNIDNNDNGIVTLSGETQSGTITLTAGQEPTGESGSLVNVPDANANLTLDFGFFVCPTSFIFPDAYVCNGNVVNLTAFEPLHYSGGTWMQGTTTLTSTLVGPGTYTYNFSNGTCISSGNITIAENIPDYTPSISIAPNAITGITNMRIILTITELLNRTPCSDVYVFVPRLEPRFTMAYEPTATVVGGVPVNNNDWQYFNTNPNFYVWKFTGASAFPGGSESKIGFLGNYDPSQTDGETSFNVQIFQGSGGELNITNNTDSEILLYFR